MRCVAVNERRNRIFFMGSHYPALVPDQPVREKQLVWTQGCNFSFSPGDTFYSDREAYTLVWSEALKTMQFCLQVQASDAGSVTFQILVPNEDRTAVVRERIGIVKPSESVRLLITGTCIGMEE